MPAINKSIKNFLNHERSRNLAEGTMEQYERTLDGLLDFLDQRGQNEAAKVNHKTLNAWLISLHKSGIGTGTRRQRIHLVKRMFQWMKARGEILIDPSSKLVLPKSQDPLPKIPPNQGAMTKLLKSMPTKTPVQIRDKAIIEIMYGCLLRRAEIISLDVSDIDLDDETLRVCLGKGAKDRILPIPEQTGDAIEAYLNVRDGLLKPNSDADSRKALFLTVRATRIGKKTILHLIRRVREQSGLEGIHPHLFRHAGAVAMLRGKADVRHVQEMLGHAHVNTSAKFYLRLVPSDLKKAYDESFPKLRV